jgi:hypothetical protein
MAMMTPAARGFSSSPARRSSALFDDGAPRLLGAVVEQRERDEPVGGHGVEEETKKKKRKDESLLRADDAVDAGFPSLLSCFATRERLGLSLSLFSLQE